METLKVILHDGGCETLNCEDCYFGKQGGICQIDALLPDKKRGTEKVFSVQELELCREQLSHGC